MAKFCGKCGRPLMEGEVCNCSEQQGNAGGTQWNGQPQGNWQNGEGEYEGTRYSRNYSTFGLWDSLKAALGIGNPELDGSDVYEEGKKIIPDIVKPNEGEVPIRQYELSSMRSTMFGITYAKAKGRLQVTNKRVMFRAPGKGIGGRTCLQHEFLVDEIGGVEAREEIMFNIGEMVLTFLVMLIGQMLAAVVMEIIENGMKSKMFFYFISVLFGSAALVPFFLVDKKWKLKAFLAGISVGVISVLVSILEDRIFWGILMIIPTLAEALCLFMSSVKPNLVLLVKPKGAASSAIEIRRRGGMGQLFKRSNSAEVDDHTGFSEIIPAVDAQKTIRELGAIINDIQKLGDYAIDKWKE